MKVLTKKESWVIPKIFLHIIVYAFLKPHLKVSYTQAILKLHGKGPFSGRFDTLLDKFITSNTNMTGHTAN